MPKEPRVEFDERLTCDRCGKFGAFLFESEKLCVDCYETRASCCAEFGADDLTKSEGAPDLATPCPSKAKASNASEPEKPMRPSH